MSMHLSELEELTLEKFIENWNNEHPEFTFHLNGTENTPLSISVRYPVSKYYGYYINNFKEWGEVQSAVAEYSRDTMVIVSDREAFAHGIIEIQIGSQMADYRNQLAVDTLMYLGQRLSPIERPRTCVTQVSER